MNRIYFSLQLANYLGNETGTNLRISIENFLEENNIYLSNHEYVCGWSVIDVLSAAENLEIKLTKREAYDILTNIEDNFDASIGINWNTIEYYVQEYIDQNPQITDRFNK